MLEFRESGRSVDITRNHNISKTKQKIKREIEYDDAYIVIHKYEKMTDEKQAFLSEYLLNILDNRNVPIVVYDKEGKTLKKYNKDLNGKLYRV